MHEVEIRIAGFTYHKDIPNPSDPSSDVRIADFATRGQTVEVNDEDYAKGQEIHAFVTDEDRAEAEAEAEAAPETDVSGMDEDQLQNWLEDDSPTVSETVEAAGDDPALAERILEAENAVTDGDPRQGVVDGLEKIIERG